MHSCCAAASDSSSESAQQTIVRFCAFFQMPTARLLDRWTEYKLARQFPNLLFSVFVHSHKHTLKNVLSLTRARIPDLQTWPRSSDLAEAAPSLSLNVSRILDEWSRLLHIQLQLPASLIPRYRRPTWLWLRLCHSAVKSDPTYAPAWLIAQLHAVYKCAQTRFPQLSIFLFFSLFV